MGGYLRTYRASGSRLPAVDFDDLIKRAEHQCADLAPFRVRAGNEALATPAAKNAPETAE
jgi:hypothetical protein